MPRPRAMAETIMSEGQHRYIHSFDPVEQDRLIWQVRLLEHAVHAHLDVSGCGSVLEVGCGVGAQLRVLARNFPHVRFAGVDHSEAQLARARTLLADVLARNQVELAQASAYALPFADGACDGACVFFVLEHLTDPSRALLEAGRVLRPGGVLYCTEGVNSGLCLRPARPALDAYWTAFNALQRDLGGDPDIGLRLVDLLGKAGFAGIEARDACVSLDGGTTDRARRTDFFGFWKAVFLSAAARLRHAGRVGDRELIEVETAFDALVDDPRAEFRYCWRQVRGTRPPWPGDPLGHPSR